MVVTIKNAVVASTAWNGTALCFSCYGSNNCSNSEKIVYEDVSDSEEAHDQATGNIATTIETDDVDDFDDLYELHNREESCSESEDEVIPP